MRKFLISCGCNGLLEGEGGRELEIEKVKCLQGCVSVKRQSGKRIYRMDCTTRTTYNATQYNFGIKTNLFNDDRKLFVVE